MNKSVFLWIAVCSFFIFSCGALEERKKAAGVKDIDTVYIEQIVDRDTTPQDDNKENGKNAAAAEEEKNIDYTYYVIIGSFKDVQNAKTLYKDLKKQGAPSKILDPVNSFNRVAIHSFDNKNDALAKLYKIRAQGGELVDAWILKRED